MSAARVPAAQALRRALRGLCPACGVGRVFGRAGRSADRCSACGWRFERGPGHWVGGNEVNLLVTFPVSVALFVVPALALGPSWWTATAGGVLALILGIAAHRPTRCVFFALDYLVDPAPDPDDLDDFEDGDGRDGRRRGDDDPDPAPPSGGHDAPIPRTPLPPRVAVVDLPVPDPSPRPDAEPHRVPFPEPGPPVARAAPPRPPQG